MPKISRFVACLAMVGVGAVAGTLSGGYTNAARGPEPVSSNLPASLASGIPAATPNPQNGDAAAIADGQTVWMKTAIVPPAPAEPSAASVVAQRFPAQWQNAVARNGGGDNDPPAQVMAYAAEPARAAPIAARAEPRAAASGFQLASANAALAPMPKRVERPAQPKPAVLFNDAQLTAIKARLRLSRDQEQYWPQVEQALRAISWKLATQQQQNAKRPVQGKQAAMIDPSSPEVARLKSAAFPLIMSMRSDQKEEVRQLAHTMGLSQVAAMF